MLIEIDFSSNEAIYIQLRNQIIMGIATSTIREGDSLPSVRQLADTIGVNMHTVNKAYAKLRELGYVSMAERSAPKVVETPPKQTRAWLSIQVEAFVAEMRRAGFSAEEVKKEVETLLNKGGSSWKD